MAFQLVEISALGPPPRFNQEAHLKASLVSARFAGSPTCLWPHWLLPILHAPVCAQFHRFKVLCLVVCFAFHKGGRPPQPPGLHSELLHGDPTPECMGGMGHKCRTSTKKGSLNCSEPLAPCPVEFNRVVGIFCRFAHPVVDRLPWGTFHCGPPLHRGRWDWEWEYRLNHSH